MPVTLQDVAAASGYSVPTVSRVLTKSSHPVSEKARVHIVETARAMGYKPNLAARSLRTDRTGVVGVLVNDIRSAFAAQMVRGIQDGLFAHEIICLIVNSDGNQEFEAQALDSLMQRPVDGIIFTEYVRMAHLARIDATNKPTIFVHRIFGEQIPNSVIADDFGGARLAVRHLASLGHTKIGYINGIADWRASIERKAGWEAELVSQGLEVRHEWMGQADWQRERGYLAAQQILALPERPTAIFGANDEIAIGAIYAAQDIGLRVPEELAIVGFDNRNFTDIVRPSITTVELPVYEMGRAAATALYAMMRGDAAPAEEIRITGNLIVRESCGATIARPGEANTQL